MSNSSRSLSLKRSIIINESNDEEVEEVEEYEEVEKEEIEDEDEEEVYEEVEDEVEENENEEEVEEETVNNNNAKLNKCECCEKKLVRYELTLDEDIYCPHCNYLKHKKGLEILRLCSTKCSELYWFVDKYFTPKDSFFTKVRYCLEKDGCINCGRRDFPSAIFVGNRLDIDAPNDNDACECCKRNYTRYKLMLDDDVYCNKCDHLKYEKGKKLNICSTLCPKFTKINGFGWVVEKYLTPKTSIHTRLTYILQKDTCTNCGDREYPKATFSGKRIK
jgi:hypothetical protein